MGQDGRLAETIREDLSADEAWRIYILLTRAEAAFRTLKSPLGERPVFHQREGRCGSAHFPVCADPEKSKICTSHIERQNLTMRMQIRRLTRLTNAFSKKWENLWAALCLHFFAWYEYYFAAFTKRYGSRQRWRRGSRTTCGPCANCWRR